MGEPDRATKIYVRRKDVFADIVNQYIYHGRQVIQPDQLRELDTASLVRTSRGTSVQKDRDVVRMVMKTDGKTAFCIIGVEDQTNVHYAMPVRGILYDAMRLDEQVQSIAKKNRKNRETGTQKTNGAAFTSGFTKNDHLLPVVTIVVHFGTEPWDGARSLHELYQCSDKRLLRLAPDYHLNLIDPATMTEKDLMKFRTNMREILQMLQCANDAEKLQNLVTRHSRFRQVDREAVDVMNATTKANLSYSKNKEKIDMCKAINDIRVEGKKEGTTEERLKNIKSIMKKLNMTAQQAMDMLDIPKPAQSKILAML